MQFFRRWYTIDDLDISNSNNLIVKDFATWGFVELDGSTLTDTYNPQPMQSNSLEMRWMYDTDQAPFLGWSTASASSASGNQFLIHRRSRDYLNIGNSADWQMSPGHAASTYSKMIFIPLRNRGFLLVCDYQSSNPEDSSVAQPPTFYPFWSYTHNVSTAAISGFGHVVFYNNVINRFNSFMTSTIVRISDGMTFDRGVGNYSSPLISLPTTTKGENRYWDYRENVCTLIKYPFDNGFLSNLFLLTTSPSQPVQGVSYFIHPGVWGKFFSFGGRNFYCPLGNLVVELPAN